MQQSALADFLESHNLHHDTCPSVSAYILERKSGLVLPSLVCIMYPRFSNVFVNFEL